MPKTKNNTPKKITIDYVERFRNFIQNQTIKVAFLNDEGKEDFQPIPNDPNDPITNNHLMNAGGLVREAMRDGCFKEWKEELLAACNKGSILGEINNNFLENNLIPANITNSLIELWKELRKCLRQRAGLWYTSWDYMETFADDCQLVANYLEQEESAGLSIYKAIDYATRTITIGDKNTIITSESVWEFIKDLCRAMRDGRIVPHIDRNINNKNNNDVLRRKLGGAEAIRELIIYTEGGYKLNPAVKILNGGQIGIHKTKYGRVPRKYKAT